MPSRTTNKKKKRSPEEPCRESVAQQKIVAQLKSSDEARAIHESYMRKIKKKSSASNKVPVEVSDYNTFWKSLTKSSKYRGRVLNIQDQYGELMSCVIDEHSFLKESSNSGKNLRRGIVKFCSKDMEHLGLWVPLYDQCHVQRYYHSDKNEQIEFKAEGFQSGIYLLDDEKLFKNIVLEDGSDLHGYILPYNITDPHESGEAIDVRGPKSYIEGLSN